MGIDSCIGSPMPFLHELAVVESPMPLGSHRLADTWGAGGSIVFCFLLARLRARFFYMGSSMSVLLWHLGLPLS